MAIVPKKSSIYNLCCSQKSYFDAFEVAEKLLLEDELIKLFGVPPYRFAGSGTYKYPKLQEKKSIYSPYHEFGVYSRSLLWRQRLWKNLPKEIQEVIPFEQVGPWKDENTGIEFKFEEEGRFSFRIPIKFSRGGVKEESVPRQESVYELKRGKETLKLLIKSVFLNGSTGVVLVSEK